MTEARVKLFMDGSPLLELYRSSDGYPSCAGRELLAGLLPAMPLAKAQDALALTNVLHSLSFETLPPFLTESYTTDYTYEAHLTKQSMRVLCRRRDSDPVLIYEEVYREFEGQVWRRTVSYTANPEV